MGSSQASFSKSAEMASSTSQTCQTFKKPLSFGDFKWIDELREDNGINRICSSRLEIIEHGEIAHILYFELLLLTGTAESFLITTSHQSKRRFEKNFYLDFKLSLSKQNVNGEFIDVFRNFEASKDGRLVTFDDESGEFQFDETFQPSTKNKQRACVFPFIERVHNLTPADFERNAKVKVELFLSIDYAKPKLTDATEPTLEEVMQKLCLKDDLSDMKIICDGQEFPCHKFILSARSDVFRTMFASPLKLNEKEESVLEIPDVSAETMKTFLQFIYKDYIKEEDIDQDLLIAADKYNIKRLVNICVKYFESIINANNVMAITFAAYLINNDSLFEKASKFIFQNHGNIKKPEEWDQITKTHPNIATKVMNLVIFENQPSSEG